MNLDCRKRKKSITRNPQAPTMSGQEPCGEIIRGSSSLTDMDSSTSIPYDDNLLDGNNLLL